LTGAAELVAESVAASSGQRAHPAASRPVVDVSLVIPAKNEARNLAWVLERVPPCVNEIILVDGDSRDATQAMAEFCWPDIRIVRQDVPGKGSALRAGFSAATGEIIVMIDADGSMSPEEIPHFVWVLEHGYDFVKGSRFVAGGGSLDITPVRRLGNRGLLAMVNALYDSQLTDLCYGFCAFRRRWLPSLNLTASGFEIETEMTIRALRAGLRVTEVASLELPRRSGRSGLRAVRDGLRVLQTVIDDRRRPFGLDGRPGLNPSSTAAAVPGGHR
jgi:glycosyltransferase involved in cell wall biosynthesis